MYVDYELNILVIFYTVRILIRISKYVVNVAQLVEHRIVVPRVVGSIPIIHPSLRLFYEVQQKKKRLRLALASPLLHKQGIISIRLSSKSAIKEKIEVFEEILAKANGFAKLTNVIIMIVGAWRNW
jgi:hypothetical protein